MIHTYLEAFTAAYGEALVWSAGEDEISAHHGAWQTVSAPEVLALIADDSRTFVAQQWRDLRTLDAAHCGHDFALTRNGHGTGFWDRGLGEIGDRLTDACNAWPEIWLYEGDDTLVYAA